MDERNPFVPLAPKYSMSLKVTGAGGRKATMTYWNEGPFTLPIVLEFLCNALNSEAVQHPLTIHSITFEENQDNG